MNELTDFISREELTQILTFLPDPQADQVLSMVENYSQLQERMQAELSEKQRLLSVIQKQESQVQNLTEKCERMNEADKIQEENRKLIARNQQLKESADDALVKMNAMKKRCDHYYTEMLIESNKQKDSLSKDAERLRQQKLDFEREKGITATERITMGVILAYACAVTIIAGVYNEHLAGDIRGCIMGILSIVKAVALIFTDFWKRLCADWTDITNGVVGIIVASTVIAIIVVFLAVIVMGIGSVLMEWWHSYYERNLNDYVTDVVALIDLIFVVFLSDMIKIMQGVNLIVVYVVIMLIYVVIRAIKREKYY